MIAASADGRGGSARAAACGGARAVPRRELGVGLSHGIPPCVVIVPTRAARVPHEVDVVDVVPNLNPPYDHKATTKKLDSCIGRKKDWGWRTTSITSTTSGTHFPSPLSNGGARPSTSALAASWRSRMDSSLLA
jgi:hypothetical protein